MSVASSNLVRVAFIPELVYGETPGTGAFDTARFTSETLSGSPQTVESKQIRTDRMSSGQVVTGLDVQGSLAVEFAKESQLESFMESFFYNTWSTLALVTVDLTYSTATRNLTRATGSWSPSIVKGDILTLAGFSNAVNNTQVIVTEVVSATVIKIAGPSGLVSETGTGTSYKRLDKLTIGNTKKSFSMEKKFTDLTDKAIVYKGMLVGSMDINVAFGELITGSLGFMGNYNDPVESSADMITNARTVNPPASSQTFNGSIDMPFIFSGAIGTFGDASGFSIKNIALKMDNNLSPQNVIGRVAARDYTTGTCKIDVDLSAYLDDDSWAILPKKLTQEPFEVGFLVKNTGGMYGFYIPALQVSFDDPASGGQNQDVMLSTKGMAKVGANGESALTIFRG